MKKLLALVLAFVICFSGFSTYTAAADLKVKVEARKIEKNEEDLSLKIIYPFFSGFKSASEINDTIQKRNISSIGYIKNAQKYIKDFKEEQKKAGVDVSYLNVSLESNFDYNFSGNILSVMINSYEYTGGAHGTSLLESYTVNTKTNEIYKKFSSLFNSSYKKAILEKINKLIDKEKDLYFDDAKKTVAAKNGDYKFYIDGNKLVIYFDLYELRPYAGGMPIFEFSAKELKGILKGDIYSQMVNSKPLEKVRFNGTTLKPQITKQTTFDRQIAEFESPDTAQEAVNMYARAVKDRKGALQYALYSDSLKAAKKAELEEMNWVTGVSSPWVTDFEIKKTGTNSYDIIFHWATSAGKADDSTVKVKVEKVKGQEFWQIYSVED